MHSTPLPLLLLYSLTTEPPDPPVDVQILSFGARWVYISWTISFDGNRAVSRARISIYSPDLEMTPERELMSGDTTYNITNLSPFTNYSFGVVACNEIGCGLQSNFSRVVMTLNDSKYPYTISSTIYLGEISRNPIFSILTYMQLSSK